MGCKDSKHSYHEIKKGGKIEKAKAVGPRGRNLLADGAYSIRHFQSPPSSNRACTLLLMGSGELSTSKEGSAHLFSSGASDFQTAIVLVTFCWHLLRYQRTTLLHNSLLLLEKDG